MVRLSEPSASNPSHNQTKPSLTPQTQPIIKTFSRTTYKRQADSDSDTERPAPSAPSPAESSSSSSSNNNNHHNDTHTQTQAQAPSKVPPFDRTLLPGGSRSLSLIATQAFALGIVLATSISLTITTAYHSNGIWRIPAFFACLSTFHFLEFWTTARYNVPAARASSFLLWSNKEYNYAHAMAMVESLLLYTFFPSRQGWGSGDFGVMVNKAVIALGVGLVALGQGVRSAAMIKAGTNFNHIPARDHKEGHELVTTGIYGRLRHPSYFGFFWWALGTQLLVGNKICLVGYGVVLWKFFRNRITAEEAYLYSFFGNDYMDYRDRVGTGIPFIG